MCFYFCLKICAITVGIKKHNSIFKKNKKNHDQIVLLAKSRLNTIEFLISNTSIDSNISQNKFVLLHNMLKNFMI